MRNGTSVADAIHAEIARHQDMIEKLKAALAALDEGSARPVAKRRKAAKKTAKKKRKLSAAGRKRIADAVKARWAKLRAEKGV